MTEKSDDEIKKILETLTPRERKVLEERFGLNLKDDDSTKSPTLEEVGRQFDITRERIRQIEEKARRKLNKNNKVNYSKFDADEPRCSFCGKYKSELRHLISSGYKANICDECVTLCMEIIQEPDD